MAEMEAAGVPLLANRDAAWEAWKGWRVNYDTVLLNLARLVEAPLAPWVSDRSPVYVTGSQGSWLRFGPRGLDRLDPPRQPKTTRVMAMATTMTARARKIP